MKKTRFASYLPPELIEKIRILSFEKRTPMCQIIETILNEFFKKKGALLLALFGILCSCSYVNQQLGLDDDNFGEELIEEAIELKTGLDIDLTPGTPE